MIDQQRLNPGRKFDQVRAGATDVFLRDGFSGASVDSIAGAAGVSKATLYSYFPEKKLMYREILLKEIGRLMAQSPIRIDEHAPPGTALPQIGRQIASWLVSDGVLRMHRTQIAEALRFPDVSQSYYSALTALLRDELRAHLDRWVAEGRLAIEDTTLAAEQFIRLSGALLHDRALLIAGADRDEQTIRRVSDGAARLFLAAHRIGGDIDAPPVPIRREERRPHTP